MPIIVLPQPVIICLWARTSKAVHVGIQPDTTWNVVQTAAIFQLFKAMTSTFAATVIVPPRQVGLPLYGV